MAELTLAAAEVEAFGKALAHELRARLLLELAAAERRISPSELTRLVDAPLTHVSYHVRRLAALKLVRQTRTRMVRGVVQHYYELTPAGREVLELLANLNGRRRR